MVEEDYHRKELEIESRLERFKFLLLEIARAKNLAIWIEGSKVKSVDQYERDLNFLERGNLVKGKMKFTERNAYREYQLTKKGSNLAKKLLGETGN